MPNLYIGVEQFKRRAGKWGAAENDTILEIIKGVSQFIEDETNQNFFPVTATRLYPWPAWAPGRSWVLWVDRHLISVATLLAKAQDSSPTTIPAADFFLEPQEFGPPYTRIEIDRSSNSAFEAGDTQQRSISVAGDWGHSATTEAAGALAEDLDNSETGVDVTDSSKVSIGDTILVDSERMFVESKDLLTTTATLNGGIAADKSIVSVTFSNGALVKAGETVTVDSERMYVESIGGNVGTVVRAYDGSVLAAHNNGAIVYAPRTLNVTRAVNGSTAATHSSAGAIVRYVAPADVRLWCMAETIAAYEQEKAGWGRAIGAGEGAREFNGRSLSQWRKQVKENYYFMRYTAI